MPILELALMLLPTVGAASGDLEVRLEKLRNLRGVVHLCLTLQPRYFPNCGEDPAALKRTVPAATASVRITGIPQGAYALAVLHDENGNGRLDSLMGIPKEGFGFSKNPRVLTGPPRFNQVRFGIQNGFTSATVRMQYLL